MNQNCVFTICAKNYLAQALTLRESTLANNADLDFHIFLSDMPDKEHLPDGLTYLDDRWLKGWQDMAYKYDVVEFSTAIKPYVIKKLFNDGYEKVSYIDPDIYVTNSLTEIFNSLNRYSAILTPHRCTMMKEGELIDEHSIILNGIFNLGFFAVKNDNIGNSIIEWWCEKLRNHCYLDLWDGLAVDQKWMEFIPAYYPQETLISHHLGMNAAIWNIHERQLIIDDNNKYVIINRMNSEDKYELLFWHFSGYSPLKKTWLYKGNSMTSFDRFPGIEKLGLEYYNSLMRNGFEIYSKMKYSFNTYDNGKAITPIHRRLFRHYESVFSLKGNPFLSNNYIYKTMDRNKLFPKHFVAKQDPRRDSDSNKKNMSKKKYAHILLRILKSIIGIDKYMMLIKAFDKFGKVDSHYFLIKDLK